MWKVGGAAEKMARRMGGDSERSASASWIVDMRSTPTNAVSWELQAARLSRYRDSSYATYGDRKGVMILSPLVMPKDRSEVLQGTLDLLVLKTLDALGPLHGYGVARRIEQISEELLRLNEGTVYASLLRLAQKRWIRSEWGVSENNRKARFYSLTKTGRARLFQEAESWERISSVIGRVLRLESRL